MNIDLYIPAYIWVPAIFLLIVIVHNIVAKEEKEKWLKWHKNLDNKRNKLS